MLNILRGFVSNAVLGALDYYRFPERGQAWGGAFNGQENRRAIFDALISTISPALILESGTYLGTTTEVMAQTGIRVVSIEDNVRYYGFARMRLRRFRNVELRCGDSRVEVRRALDIYQLTNGTRPLFAYLDAHWQEDLPLAEELEIILSACSNAVIMIDDFKVPNDPGYGYDNYGPGKVLDLTYIADAIKRYGLAALCPSCCSAQETGARRGCVVLAKSDVWKIVLLATGGLRSVHA